MLVEADDSTSISSNATIISGEKKNPHIAQNSVPKLNPVFELLKPEEVDRSVVEILMPALSELPVKFIIRIIYQNITNLLLSLDKFKAV